MGKPSSSQRILTALLSALTSGGVAASVLLSFDKHAASPFLPPSPVITAETAVLHTATPENAGSAAEFHIEGVPAAHAEARSGRVRESQYFHGSTVLHTLPLTERVWKGFEEERKMLLRRSITLETPPLPGLEPKKWHLTLVEHPEWILLQRKEASAHAVLDLEAIRAFLEREIAAMLPAPTHARITALPAPGELYASVEGRVTDGWALRTEGATPLLAASLINGTPSFTLPIERAVGRIINETPFDLGPLTLLGKGRSNFAGSVPNRAFNVQKTLREHLQNIFILPGETFSFNRTLGGAVEVANGWKMAMGIFNGEDLALTPGGGVCQASTTLYRGVLQAGLPVVEQHNHSLYIKYYREYGEGLDATIYPGSRDFMFLNDTSYPILLQARDEGNEAIVELYGTPDGRKIALEGPYRWYDAPEDVKASSGRALYRNEIAWKQRIIRNDGKLEEHILVSRYTNEIPAVKPAGADIL